MLINKLVHKKTFSVALMGWLIAVPLSSACSYKNSCNIIPPDTDICRDRAIWEQPSCPSRSGKPISFGRFPEASSVGFQLYGYAKWEGFWDTRQPLGSREEETLFFPAPKKIDPLGKDINAHEKWHMTAIESRLGLALTGPSWGSIKTLGVLEGDFRGSTETTISCFRQRHAYGLVSWETGSFLFGQWYQPLFIVECFPHTVGFDVGIPLDSQARAPQLLVTQRWKDFELRFCLASERDFASNGPDGVSSLYIRNSVIPNMHLQARFYFGDNLFGIAGDFRRLVPRIESSTGYSVNEKVDGFVVEAFLALMHAPWSARFKVFWGENANIHLLLSGFGVSTIEPITDKRTYSPTAGVGAWTDFSYIFGCDDKELGIFFGGIKNIGSRDRLYVDPVTKVPLVYSFSSVGQNIDYVIRTTPRFVLKKDPIRFGAEFDWTRASYGTPDCFGKIDHGVPVDIFRILFTLYYVF